MAFDAKSLFRQNFNQLGGNLSGVAYKILGNDTLCKLLLFTTDNALEMEITEEQKEDMFNDNIRIVPVLPKDVEMKNYLIIQFDNFSTNRENDEFKDYIITFDIICNTQNWLMGDYMPRPYKIMNQIDIMFNGERGYGAGPLQFIGANSLLINEDLAGFTMIYKVTDLQ